MEPRRPAAICGSGAGGADGAGGAGGAGALLGVEAMSAGLRACLC